jgi:hypothetical protein
MFNGILDVGGSPLAMAWVRVSELPRRPLLE